ncbi:MAG: hypothetical protein RIR11_4506 [Bacteroidota bacterium]|jgi:hypothetical protein
MNPKTCAIVISNYVLLKLLIINYLKGENILKK